MKRSSSYLWRDQSGAVIIEFALLAPVMLGLLIAVFQIGIGMQAYNALRSISGDVARFAVVNYQTDNELQNSELQAVAEGIASNMPYALNANELDIVIEDAADQRVDGAKELTISIDYQLPTILGFFGFESPEISFTRPIFLIED